MYKLENLVSEIATSGHINIGGQEYEVNNCIIAATDEVVKMCLHVLLEDQLVRISVESVKFLKRD